MRTAALALAAAAAFAGPLAPAHADLDGCVQTWSAPVTQPPSPVHVGKDGTTYWQPAAVLPYPGVVVDATTTFVHCAL